MAENKEKSPQPELFRAIQKIGVLSSVPFLLVSGPLTGFLIGYWFHLSSFITVALTILGLLASIREVIRIVKREARD